MAWTFEMHIKKPYIFNKIIPYKYYYNLNIAFFQLHKCFIFSTRSVCHEVTHFCLCLFCKCQRWVLLEKNNTYTIKIGLNTANLHFSIRVILLSPSINIVQGQGFRLKEKLFLSMAQPNNKLKECLTETIATGEDHLMALLIFSLCSPCLSASTAEGLLWQACVLVSPLQRQWSTHTNKACF